MEVWAVASVPWTPGDENDTSLPRLEGPQKVSASRVPARGYSFAGARHAAERTSTHALLTVSFELRKRGCMETKRGPRGASESPPQLWVPPPNLWHFPLFVDLPRDEPVSLQQISGKHQLPTSSWKARVHSLWAQRPGT